MNQDRIGCCYVLNILKFGDSVSDRLSAAIAAAYNLNYFGERFCQRAHFSQGFIIVSGADNNDTGDALSFLESLNAPDKDRPTVNIRELFCLKAGAAAAVAAGDNDCKD